MLQQWSLRQTLLTAPLAMTATASASMADGEHTQTRRKEQARARRLHNNFANGDYALWVGFCPARRPHSAHPPPPTLCETAMTETMYSTRNMHARNLRLPLAPRVRTRTEIQNTIKGGLRARSERSWTMTAKIGTETLAPSDFSIDQKTATNHALNAP